MPTKKRVMLEAFAKLPEIMPAEPWKLRPALELIRDVEYVGATAFVVT
jgi:cysteine synthase